MVDQKLEKGCLCLGMMTETDWKHERVLGFEDFLVREEVRAVRNLMQLVWVLEIRNKFYYARQRDRIRCGSNNSGIVE